MLLLRLLEWWMTQLDKAEAWTSERYGPYSRKAEAIPIVLVISTWLAAAALVLGALWLATVAVVTAVDALLTPVGQAWAGNSADWYLTVVTRPVSAYLATHTQALGVTPTQITAVLLVAGMALWTLSVFRSVAARVGWVLYGLALVAMTFAGSPDQGRWLAAGIMLLYWALLSIPALSRLRRRVVINQPPADLEGVRQALDQIREEIAGTGSRLGRLEESTEHLAALRVFTGQAKKPDSN